jgi:hypothetical protein
MSHKKYHGLIISWLIISSVIPSYSQEQPVCRQALSDFVKAHPAEYVYVHTDRDIYSLNDSIWFKVYLCNAHTLMPQPGLRNVYVELLDASNSIQARNLIPVTNGSGKGDLVLSNYKLEEGRYSLRVYTDYQRNFGSAFFFRKKLWLKKLRSNQFEYEAKEMERDSLDAGQQVMDIDLQFLPEGGTLVANRQNTVAFIASDVSGRPLDVSGWIVDSQNNRLTSFRSVHQGMGKLMMIPQKDEQYTALIDGLPHKHISMPMTGEGVQLAVRNRDDAVISVRLWCEHVPEERYYLINSAKGEVTFYLPIEMETQEKDLHVGAHNFASGVNQLTLADETMKPVAERLVFIHKQPLMNLELTADKHTYSRRERVEVQVKSLLNDRPIPAHLSVSVLNGTQVKLLEEYPQNIVSHLLLDSELKGILSNAGFYFKDDSTVTKEKLDLLMLTHGWRRYNWNAFSAKLPMQRYEIENGIHVQGKVKRLFSKKGVTGGEVTLFLNDDKGGFLISQAPTDSLGYFEFPSLVFPDSINAFVQGVNKRGRKNTEIVQLNSVSVPPLQEVGTLSFHLPNERSQVHFNKMAYQRFADDKVFFPEKNSIMLNEVNVTSSSLEKNKMDDGHHRIYSVADDVLVVTDRDLGYTSIWNYLAGRVAGLQVSGNSVTIRGAASFYGSSEPHFLLDGAPVDKDMLDGISMSDIDKIEVLKSIGSTAIFGMQGANGVIAVYTKTGEAIVRDDYVLGVVSEKLKGYYEAREFYSPAYSLDSVSELPDHRATLYWDPGIRTDSIGTAAFSFYTSDDQAPILIYIEGLSMDGNPGVGLLELEMGRDH